MVFKKKKDDSEKDVPAPKTTPARESAQGNWKCADCGQTITELPFEPSADRPIYCKDCWLKRRERGRRERGFRSEPVQGNWQCADCGQTITELPFNPAADRPIYCRECWRKKKEQGLSY